MERALTNPERPKTDARAERPTERSTARARSKSGTRATGADRERARAGRRSRKRGEGRLENKRRRGWWDADGCCLGARRDGVRSRGTLLEGVFGHHDLHEARREVRSNVTTTPFASACTSASAATVAAVRDHVRRPRRLSQTPLSRRWPRPPSPRGTAPRTATREVLRRTPVRRDRAQRVFVPRAREERVRRAHVAARVPADCEPAGRRARSNPIAGSRASHRNAHTASSVSLGFTATSRRNCAEPSCRRSA